MLCFPPASTGETILDHRIALMSITGWRTTGLAWRALTSRSSCRRERSPTRHRQRYEVPVVGLSAGMVRLEYCVIFAAARSPVACGAMIESLLRRMCVRLLAMPDLESRLLDHATERKRQLPGQLRLEPDIHGIQTCGGKFAGLAARQKRNPRNSGGHDAQKASHGSVRSEEHRLLYGAGHSRKYHVGRASWRERGEI